MTNRRIFFINRFYWPEEPATAQLLTDLATQLASLGHVVTVITSHPGGSCPRSEQRDGVRILRVRSTRWGKRSLLGRGCDFVSFYPAALLRLLLEVRSGDGIVALTDPPLIGVVAWLAARLRRAHLIHWVQDIYPEIAVTVTGRRWPLLLRGLRNRAWRDSVHCVVPGHDMAKTLTNNRIPRSSITVSPNWPPAGVESPAPEAVVSLRRQWQLENKFVVAYSGNLGRVHEVEAILETADRLRQDPDFVFLFIGHGARREATEQTAIARSLDNVRFLPPQPRAQLSVALGVGDVHFVTLREEAERYVFPSKLYGIAQVGRPVVFIGAPQSELATLIAEHGFGATYARTEISQIAQFLLQLKNDPAGRRELGHRASTFAPTLLTDAVVVWDRLLRTTANTLTMNRRADAA